LLGSAICFLCLRWKEATECTLFSAFLYVYAQQDQVWSKVTR